MANKKKNSKTKTKTIKATIAGGWTNITVNNQPPMRRVCIAVPTTGNLRIEWVMSRFGAIIPVNWTHGEIFQFYDQYSPINYVVADTRNICVQYSLDGGYEWTFFIDHDTCIPQETFVKLNTYMDQKKYPVVCGLYYCKGAYPEPLIFRGRGNGYFSDWKFGDLVEVDAVPMGCTLIHNSVLKKMAEESEVYTVNSLGGPVVVRRVFETPKAAWRDPETGKYNSYGGTEDIPWCDRVMRDNVLERTGWKVKDKKNPFICDTSIFCQHIDNNGTKFPGPHYKKTKQYQGSRLEIIENGNNGDKVIKTAGSQY